MTTKKRIKIRKVNGSKAICDNCNKLRRVRNMICFKGKYLCGQCKSKTESALRQLSACQIGKPYYTLEEALNKVYNVYTYFSEKKGRSCQIGLPSILSGKKVKLVLVE